MVTPDVPAGANPVGQALAEGDAAALSAALRSSRVALPVAERDGAVVPAILTDGAGTRSLAAFTSQDALARWGAATTVEMVPGHALPDLAQGQRVDDVLFDPAGPTPVRFGPGQLRAIVDGVVGDVSGRTRLIGELELVPASSPEGEELGRRLLERIARTRSIEVYLVDRLVGQHFVLTVGVYGSDDDYSMVRRAVEEVAPGTGPVDVLRLDRRTRKTLRRDMPRALLSAADES
jgi:hypothetical protein